MSRENQRLQIEPEERVQQLLARYGAPDVRPSDGYVAGWTWSYPLKAALEEAVEGENLTLQGLLDAIKSLDTVDYEGILPADAGNFSGKPGDAAFRQTLIQKVDEVRPPDSPSSGTASSAPPRRRPLLPNHATRSEEEHSHG